VTNSQNAALAAFRFSPIEREQKGHSNQRPHEIANSQNSREDAVISVAVHVEYMPENFISGHEMDGSLMKRLPTLPPTENHHALHQTDPRAWNEPGDTTLAKQTSNDLLGDRKSTHRSEVQR